jgi:subtilisin family serine protease
MTAAVQKIRQKREAFCTYRYPRLLSFIRMAGLILDRQQGDQTADEDMNALLDRFSGDSTDAFIDARTRLTERILRAWSRTNLPQAGSTKLVYSVSRNRPARLAVAQSVRTVKGDAAASLFTINCSALTWAVMDCGIDATHHAFRRHPEQPLKPDGETPTRTELLKRSRVKETYDFAYLRELLIDPESSKLPAHLRQAVNHAGTQLKDDNLAARKRMELRQRIEQASSIDWDLLRPFIQVEHGDSYPMPLETHGTHVAGILGAKWKEEENDPAWLQGMCPDIELIDIRVCREDGSSDEFVIMSALQFIRHLNSSSDRPAIHGVNMSLSLDHDAAVYACGRTPVCEEAERTVANGVVVVAAAGNLGYRRVLGDGDLPFDQFCPVSITDPGNAENVITVGATHRLEPHTYGVSYFSSRGPTGDGRVKPDLVAPGEKIYAPALGGGAIRLDGTSMAAPHVSGAAAMLMARHVELVGNPRRIKEILCRTATDLGREPYFQGRGLVDVLRAIQSV